MTRELVAFSRLPEITAFFTTRSGGFSPPPFSSLNLGMSTGDSRENVMRNWRELSDKFSFNLKSLKMPEQVHSDTLCSAGDFAEGSRPPADAVYSRTAGDVLAVSVADCLPVLIFDPNSRTIAAVHAGWRGTRLRILEKTLNHLKSMKQIHAGSTRLSFGPGIQSGSYRVGEDVAKQFDREFLSEKDGQYLLDLSKANAVQALSCGVPEKNLEVSKECTFSQPERFFSYRRDGNPTGRMAAVIKLA